MVEIKCSQCKKEIQRGNESQKVVVYYKTPSGEEFRHCKFDNTGDPPRGSKLLRAIHYKEDKYQAKRILRGGDAVKGRGMGDIPTAYEVSALTMNRNELEDSGLATADAANTREFTERVRSERQAAIASGTVTGFHSVEDIQRRSVALQRELREKGIDITDEEARRRIRFQLAQADRAARVAVDEERHFDPEDRDRAERENHRATLYAVLKGHGLSTEEASRRANFEFEAQELKREARSDGIEMTLDEARAQVSLRRVEAERAQDPGYSPPAERDWRDQLQVDVEHLPPPVEPTPVSD